MKFLQWLGVTKPPQTPVKKLAPAPRITVHLKDGTRVVHKARSRRTCKDGTLELYSCSVDKLNQPGEGNSLVAEYAPGSWVCITTGFRQVLKEVKGG